MMDMQPYVWWAVLGLGLIIVDMMAATLILMILGVAAFAGAALAWFGLSFQMQAVGAVVVAAIGMIVVSARKKEKTAQDVNSNSLDFGHTVIVESWVSEADGVAKVRYRNATWDAKVIGPHATGSTVFYICATDGSTLHISSTKPQ